VIYVNDEDQGLTNSGCQGATTLPIMGT